MCRVLIVEDEMLVAMLVEQMMQELGHEVIACAQQLEEAESIARRENFDVAILDMNLNGKKSFPVAQILTDRGIPYIFASGYGTAGLTDPFREVPVLCKPFALAQMEQMLKPLLPV